MMKNNQSSPFNIKKLLSFRRDANGQVSLLFALLLLPLAAFIGGAIDFTQQISYTSKLQATLDSVSLAAAKAYAKDSSLTAAKLKAIGDVIYKANHVKPSNITISAYTLEIVDENLIVRQTGNLKTAFMGLVGTPNLAINVASTVNMKRSNIELALILDTTLSMIFTSSRRPDPGKLESLKTASRNLVETLLKSTTGLSSTRISLVPWSTGVNVWSNRKKAIKGNKKGKHYCAGSRNKPADKSPLSKPLPFSFGNKEKGKNKPEQCPNREIVPLTDNKAKLLAEINTWTADHWTASDAGLTWGWGTLSPKWKNYWPNKSQPLEYKSDVKKFAILMTDGDNTLNHIKSDKRSVALCDAMKDKGIQIYTIAFKVTTSKAVKLLQNCASTSDMYINAASNDALNAAFKKIADEVGSFYISG